MRKTLTALFLMVCMLLSCSGAWAESIFPTAETGVNGQVTYPASDNERWNEWLQTRLHIGDALILLRGGAEIAGETSVYTFTAADDTPYTSICFTQRGKIRFGRYGESTHAVLMHGLTGEEMLPDVLFSDMDAAQSALDAYVEEQVLPQLNTYLDATDLLPVPLDNICLSEQGMTIHYPADRFSFFSGNSGAVEIRYYEMADLLHENVRDALMGAPAGAQELLAAAADGHLYGLQAVRLGDSLPDTLEKYGALGDSDFTADAEMYEMEAPFLRGVQLMTAREDESALLTGIRAQRLNLGGLRTGISTREACMAVLGKAQAEIILDGTAAESYRLPEGMGLAYAAGEFTLWLYFDENDVLHTIEIRQ